jgi:uncharacterized protein DUF5648
MLKNTCVCLLVLAGICVVSTCLEGVAVAQDGAETTTFGTGEPLRVEDFDDNAQGGLWRAYIEDPNTCRVIETNGRLELRTTEEAYGAFAGYISSGWRFDPREDFALRVDFHYDLKTLVRGRINIGLTPSDEDPRSQRIDFGVGCTDKFPSYWYEAKNGWSIRTSYVNRIPNDGTIYLSYDAASDVVYLSDAAYGPENAWITVTGFLKDQWGGEPVHLYLGGMAEDLAIASGNAYLDNLVVEQGVLIEPASAEVYRFWSPVTGTHYYTIDAGERDALIKEFADVWDYEGVAFRVPGASDPNAAPVYRFWSENLASHFYTINEWEKDKLVDQYADVWAYEGPVFYAYPVDKQPGWALPVYRFWSASKSTHFFTIDEQERDKLLSQFSNVWVYEGIAWYANQ